MWWTSAIREEGEAATRCIGIECPARNLRNIEHFASKEAMNIEGLGEKVIRQLYDKKLINNIFNKYKIEDIKIVIDKKTLEWINNPKMSSYLRPETLLGSKFERYLYQKNEPKTIKDITLADIQKAKEIRDNKKNG